MAEINGEFPTVLGPDARFKGEVTFDKGLRILGNFEGQIKSKGTLHVAEGAKVVAQIEAHNVRVDGEIRGNVICAEKLQLSATSKIDGDLRAARLEMNDGAQFVGHVAVGATATETPARREPSPSLGSVRQVESVAPAPRGRPMPEPSPISISGASAGR